MYPDRDGARVRSAGTVPNCIIPAADRPDGLRTGGNGRTFSGGRSPHSTRAHHMLRSIVVPLDGSPLGEHAIPPVIPIARRFGATVHLLHVHLPAVPPSLSRSKPRYSDRWDEEMRAEEQHYLDGVAARLTDAGIEATVNLVDGAVVEAIHTFARRRKAGLIAMTTHGHGAFARVWLGSVADGLVRHANMPILLVRPGEKPPGARVEQVFHHVLVPVDQSAVAEEVLACALTLGEPGATRYTLLRVVPPALPGGPELAEHGARDDPLDLEEARSLAELTRIAGVMRARGIPIEAKVVRHPQPARGILEYAGDHGIDAIAMATRGRAGLSRLLLGSVTDKVLRGTTLPILLYGPQGRPPASSNQAA